MIEALNLFGEKITLQRKTPLPKGYPARPGTGPAGETCGSCVNLHRKLMSKTYPKCLLLKHCWTGGKGSDVKVRSPACSLWKAKEAL